MSGIPRPDGGDINIGAPMMRTIWTLYGITIVIVAARLYAQLTVRRQWTLITITGDAMMTLSVACGLALCSMLTIQHHYGLGRHFFFLDDHQKIMAIKFNFIGQSFGVMAPSFGRMACIMLMLQLFGTTQNKRWGLWFLFWQSLFVNGMVVILIFVQCKDVRSLWDAHGHPSACWSPNVQEFTGFAQGGLNAATDLILTILPMTIFWNLQISKKLKFGLGILLGLSIFAFIACIIKTVELRSLGDRLDFTYNTVPFFTWVIVECTLVNIAASVPLIRPLFVRYQKSGTADSGQTYEMKNRYALNSKKGSRGTRLGSQDLEPGANNSSEENILPLEGTNVSGKEIIKQTTYEVNYEKSDAGKLGPKSAAWNDTDVYREPKPTWSPGVGR